MYNRLSKFSQTLNSYLGENDMSVTDFCAKHGFSTSTISGYLSRGHEPKVHMALKLAKALNTTVEELWGQS